MLSLSASSHLRCTYTGHTYIYLPPSILIPISFRFFFTPIHRWPERVIVQTTSALVRLCTKFVVFFFFLSFFALLLAIVCVCERDSFDCTYNGMRTMRSTLRRFSCFSLTHINKYYAPHRFYYWDMHRCLFFSFMFDAWIIMLDTARYVCLRSDDYKLSGSFPSSAVNGFMV